MTRVKNQYLYVLEVELSYFAMLALHTDNVDI